MTIEQHKEHNAKYYPASVLHWLNEATDRAFKEFEERLNEQLKLNKFLNSTLQKEKQ